MSTEVKAKRERKKFGFFKVLYFGKQLNIIANSSKGGSKQLNTPSLQV